MSPRQQSCDTGDPQELDAWTVWARSSKRRLRLVNWGLHWFCLWRVSVWERGVAEAQKRNDWVVLRTVLCRQELWESRARVVDPSL